MNQARTLVGRGQPSGCAPGGEEVPESPSADPWDPRQRRSKLPAAFAKRFLSREFEALVAPGCSPAAWPAGDVIGLEHEYRVFTGARTVDFRSVIHHLGLGRPRLDPADLNAYRLASGTLVTADETEAEIALPPTFVRPGCGHRIAVVAASERRYLAARLPPGAGLEGYSTHLSVAVRPSSSEAIAKLYATTFSAALMLLMDSARSPGLLVRPRPSRLELGGEFVDGERLAVAATFAVGSVRACGRQLEQRDLVADFPDKLSVDIEPDDQRYGWFVSRRAFASDLYTSGREAQLRRRRGSPITAQAHLERCWAAARTTLLADVDATELRLVDKVVLGNQPLPAATPSVSGGGLADLDPDTIAMDAIAGAFGFAAESHSRPGYDLAPVMLTWDRAVFVISNASRDRRLFANVPSALLTSFATQLNQGALDATIRSYLAVSGRGRRLGGTAPTSSRACLYDHLAPRARLLVPEKAPRDAKRARKRFAAVSTGRHGRNAALESDKGSGGQS